MDKAMKNPPNEGIRSQAKTALSVLTAINALNYLDRFVSAPILPLIIAGLHLSDGQAGSLQSAFILVFALVCPLVGGLVDRYPRYWIAAIGVILWSAATLGSGLATSFAFLLVARALVGIGEASYTVVTPSILADHYPAERRGRALSIFYAAIPFGSALGYVLGGQIGAHHGWRSAFFVAGIPGIFLAMILLHLREPRRGQKDAPTSANPDTGLGAFLKIARSRPSYILNVISQSIYTFTVGGLAAWMPTYLVRYRHLAVDKAALFFGGILALAGLLGTLGGGYLGDKLARRFPGAHFTFSGLALIASLPFSVVAVISPNPSVYWTATFLSLLFLFVVTGPLNAAMVNVLPAPFRGRGVGVHTIIIHLLGDACSPILIGIASDRVGLPWPILATGLYVGIAGALLVWGRKTLDRDLAASAN